MKMTIYRDVGIAADTPAMHGDWCPAGIFSSRSHFITFLFPCGPVLCRLLMFPSLLISHNGKVELFSQELFLCPCVCQRTRLVGVR